MKHTYQIVAYRRGGNQVYKRGTLRATMPAVAVKRFLDGGEDLMYATVGRDRVSLKRGEQLVLTVTRTD